MHKNVTSLMDINFEVMVGKRNANCISCGVGPDQQKIERHFSGGRGNNNMSVMIDTKHYSMKHV